MKRTLSVFVFGLFLAAGLSMGACVVDDNSTDAHITCDNLDSFLATCASNCGATWGCEDNYDSLDLDTQSDLDACSDCLADNAAAGVCDDCAVPSLGIDSCLDFMDTFLGTNCW